MQKNIFLLIALSVSFFSKADELKVKSNIKEVTVFLNGAAVTSTGTQNISSGSHELVFENLSPFIDINSIQAKGEGNFTILGVKFRTNYLGNQPKPKEIKNLEDTLESLQNRLELIKGQRSAYENEEAFLLAHKNIGGANTGVSSADLEKVANMLRARLPDLKAKIIDSKTKEKKLNEEISKVSKQLGEINAGRNKNTGEVVVSVFSKTAGTAKVFLTYNVSNAGWVPIYDIRATDSNSPVKLDYRAQVFQNTGDDWKNVKLSLSTGNPSVSGTKPELNPWWISYYDPYRTKTRSEAMQGRSPAPSAAPQREAMELSVQSDAKADYSSDYTNVSEGQTNFLYEISIPYDIPSDGKEHAVSVQSYNIPAVYKYYSVPKIDPDAFLVARISGWEQYNLLSGEANVFFEGTFVGKSFLNTIFTSDTLDISLGRDKSVIVTRELLKDLSEKRFFGNNKKESRSYEISVRNKKSKEIEIEIEDQVPLSRNHDLEVEITELSGGNYKKESGLVTWSLKISPAETKKLKLGYSVKYPKDKVIANLK
jgi:uncharacterized protein (TIGR02231 family)